MKKRGLDYFPRWARLPVAIALALVLCALGLAASMAVAVLLERHVCLGVAGLVLASCGGAVMLEVWARVVIGD